MHRRQRSPFRVGRHLPPRVALSIGSTLATVLALELATRLRHGELLATDNRVVAHRWKYMSSVYQYDPLLGWSPRPGARATGLDIGWRGEVFIPGVRGEAVLTILQDGIRSNGLLSALPPRPLVLAVGDSFTFGSRVSDHQTWPAVLERLLDVRVLNAGVSAYGLDQSVLCAEQLVPEYRPDLLIVSFIIDDLRRNMSSKFKDFAQKPFFMEERGALALMNVPVPSPREDLDWFRSVFGHSFLVSAIMRRLDSQYWWHAPPEYADNRESRIGCLLMGRLEALRRRFGTNVLVVAQQARPAERPEHAEYVLACAARRGLPTLSLFGKLRSAQEGAVPRSPASSLFFDHHMTPAGNEGVASVLARDIRLHRRLAD